MVDYILKGTRMKKINLTEKDKKEILKAVKNSSRKNRKKPYQGIESIK